MSDAVTERLRRLDALAAELRRRETASGAMARAIREARRSAVVDMSPPAIDQRLSEASQLRDLCLRLGALGAAR